MTKVLVLSLLILCSNGAFAGQTASTAKQGTPPRAMCEAAAPKLRESATSNVVLLMVIDTRGRVESFHTESPKSLRLEKIKKAAASIETLQFTPAKKDGKPVRAMVRFTFDCSRLQAEPSNKAQP